MAPGYEHKIKGSVKYNKNTNIASGKLLLNISLSEKDAAPFVPHGKISTLNEDFATPGGEEFVAKSMKGLQEKYSHSSGEEKEKTKNAMYALQSLSENESFFTLKNSQGYAFIPFGISGGGGNPLYGLRLNIKRNTAPYQSIRFRLKKLTDRKLVFEDIKKDSDIGGFFESDRKLKYTLSTDVTAMSYHDVLRPGGVAQLYQNPTNDKSGSSGDSQVFWNTITPAEVSAGTLSSSVPVVDGDCIIFKNTENNIVARKPYPVRVSVNESTNIYTLTPLIVYTPADIAGVTTKLAFTVNNNQAYKIVNYFSLGASGLEADKNTHRAVAPMNIKSFYEIDDSSESPASTIKYPIVVGSKRFYIEEGAVFDASNQDKAKHIASIDKITDSKIGASISVRVNLELSSVAKHWLSERTDWRTLVETSLSGENPNAPAPHWNQKVGDDGDIDVFSNFRNILYRAEFPDEYISPVQMELVSQSGDIFNVRVKLATNADYRYIYKSYNEIIKIEINGEEISSNTAGIIKLTSPDILIQVETADRAEDLNKTFNTVIREKIYKNFLLIESAECVDQIDSNGNALSYFDYQIPKLSTDSSIYGNFSDSEPLIRPYDSYFTENYDWLTAYGHKEDNLVRPDRFGAYGNFEAGLLYDGGMPASVKYIYPEVVDSKGRVISSALTAGSIKVRFFIDKGYWDGFKDRFGGEGELFRTRPETIKCDLQKLNGSNWEDVSWASGEKGVSFNKIDIKYDWQVSSADLEIGSGGYNPSASYRLKITKVRVAHGKNTDSNKFENEALRFPFSLSRTTIFDRDITTSSIENGSKGIWEHRVSLIENPIIKNSPAFPAEGLTKLGKYEFKKIVGEEGSTITLPCTRLYMFRLKHNLQATYQDKIRKNGIGKINITSLGKDYKVPPSVAIAKPNNASKDDFSEASARAMIEAGKLRFIEVVDSGAGYFDLDSLLEKDDTDAEKKSYISSLVKNSKKSATPIVLHSFVIQESFNDASCVITGGQSYVTHSGNIGIAIAGAKVTGTGIPSNTKVLSVDSSVKFTLSKNATQTGTVTLTFYSTEPELAFMEEGSTVKTTAVTLSGGGGPTEEPESFGLSYLDTEAIAKSEDLDVTSSRAEVDLMKGSSEDDETWGLIRNQAARIQRVKDATSKLIKDSSDNSSHGIFTEDEYSDPKGRENPNMDGLYEEGELDTLEEPVETIETSDGGEHGIVISTTTPTQGEAIAIINDRSPANYRIIDNEIANNATPHFSSFSREDDPAMPKSFGIVPTASLNAEVFNTYARAINNMHSIVVEAPIYAKVRRYRQYEYRYIEDMAGLEFESDPKSANYTEVADQRRDSGEFWELDYTEFDNKSKVNFFTFVDKQSGDRKRAYFSAFAGDAGISTKDNIVNIEGKNEEDKILYNFDEDEFGPANIDAEGNNKFNEKNTAYTPRDIGLPSQVNIGKSNGVVCPPDQPVADRAAGRIEDGMELPKFQNTQKRRAFAYSGEKVFTSEIYDITDEDFDLADKSFVDIRGSEYIYSSSENEIIFGCFSQGKPFLSTFLKTTREWTEYEVIISPEFASTLPVGVRDKYRPDETKLRGNLVTQRIACSNEKFSTVEKSKGYHSLCYGGNPINGIYDPSVSYESLFGLNEGEAIIGPVETESETSQGVFFRGKGVLKVKPEFNLSLAVYATHESRQYRVANSYSTSNLHWVGPCIHKCSPMIKETFHISDDPLLFDLRK